MYIKQLPIIIKKTHQVQDKKKTKRIKFIYTGFITSHRIYLYVNEYYR